MQHIKPNVVCPNLEQTVHDVIAHVAPVEHEVCDTKGHWYSMRVRPYCSIDNRIEGAIIALVDIDAVKRREEESRRRIAAILQAIHDGLLVLDNKGSVQMANDSFCRLFGLDAGQVTGRPLTSLGDGAWETGAIQSLLGAALASDSAPPSIEIEHDFPRVGRRKLLCNARRIAGGDDRPPLALLVVRET